MSISTVSRVLNHKGNVNPDTRARVEAVLQSSHYTPSAIARGMMSKSLRTVAVLAVDMRNPHYARTAYTIEREFSRLGYEVTLCNTGGERDEAAKYLRSVLEKHADGIVLVGSVFNRIGRDPRVSPLLCTVPVVLANGSLDLPNSYSVLVDDRHGVALAVEHLLARGHRDIFFIKDLDTDSARAKRDGFVQAMEQAGFPDAAQRVLEIPQSLEGGIQAAGQLLRLHKSCTAVICSEDITAAGVLKGLLRAGVRVPQDIAVVGYNGSEYARICEPQLTTVDNKPELVGLLSVQLLANLIEKNGSCASVTIQPELLLGQTS